MFLVGAIGAATSPTRSTTTTTTAATTAATTTTVTTCSVATVANDFSAIVTGPESWYKCTSLMRSWNVTSPSAYASGTFFERAGTYRQFQASTVCSAGLGQLETVVKDSGSQAIGQDVCRWLVVLGWTLND